MRTKKNIARALTSLASMLGSNLFMGLQPVYGQEPVLDRISSSATKQDPGGRLKAEYQILQDIRFRTPDGWKMTEPNPNSRIFVSPDSVPGKDVVMILLRGPEFQGDFQEAFDRSIAGTLQDRKTINKLDVRSSQTREGYDVLTQAVFSEDKQGQRIATLYNAVNVNGRLAALAYVSPDQQAFLKHSPVATHFLADLRFPARKPGSAESAGNSSTSQRPAPRAKSPNEVAADEEKRRKPGKVAGTVYDAQGRPFNIPGAAVHIHVWGVTAAGERTFFDGDADAHGHYEIPVVHGLYAVNCTAKMPLGGATLTVDLEVLDGRRPSLKEDSTPGICKDFGLKLTGPVFEGAPGTYHGGYVTLTDGGAYHSLFDALSRRYPAGTTVQLTLTPRGRLIDGSPAAPITLSYSLVPMQTGQTMGGIPLALYTATARIVTPDGRKRPLKIGLFPGNQYGASVDFVFAPEPILHGMAGTPNLVVAE